MKNTFLFLLYTETCYNKDLIIQEELCNTQKIVFLKHTHTYKNKKIKKFVLYYLHLCQNTLD